MQYEPGPDLKILGCRAGDPWDVVKRSYRSEVRRLHRDLIESRPWANERLARVNAAYDRLKAATPAPSEAPVREEPPVQPGTSQASADLTGLMTRDIAMRRFRASFEAGVDKASGVYGDPRRRTGARHALPTLVQLVSVSVREGRVELAVSGPLAAGQNTVVLPKIRFQAGGRVEMGPELSAIDFSLTHAGRSVRIDPARLPFPHPPRHPRGGGGKRRGGHGAGSGLKLSRKTLPGFLPLPPRRTEG